MGRSSGARLRMSRPKGRFEKRMLTHPSSAHDSTPADFLSAEILFSDATPFSMDRARSHTASCTHASLADGVCAPVIRAMIRTAASGLQ